MDCIHHSFCHYNEIDFQDLKRTQVFREQAIKLRDQQPINSQLEADRRIKEEELRHQRLLG